MLSVSLTESFWRLYSLCKIVLCHLSWLSSYSINLSSFANSLRSSSKECSVLHLLVSTKNIDMIFSIKADFDKKLARRGMAIFLLESMFFTEFWPFYEWRVVSSPEPLIVVPPLPAKLIIMWNPPSISIIFK